METLQTVLHIDDKQQQKQENKQITEEYVLDLIENQEFLPLNVTIQFLAQNWNIQQIINISQAYVKQLQSQNVSCDESAVTIASYLCNNLNQVKSNFAADFQKALFNIFKLSQAYQEIILLKLSEYYTAGSKIAQFALHLIKTLNGWLLGRQNRYLDTKSFIQQRITDNLVRHKAIDSVCDTPQDTYFSNIMKYLGSSSEKISIYTKQKFGELIIPIPANRVAYMLYNNGFVVDATKLTKDEILSATEQIHEFLPNQILYEYLSYTKGAQVFLKEKIKYKQSIEPELQKFMFQQDWASKLNTSSNHKIIQETLNQLYNAVNPFLDCQYETDQFEEDQIQAINKYLIFIEEFIQLDLNTNYDQSYELAFKFMSAIILYGKGLYKDDIILTKISDIIFTSSSQEKFKEHLYLLLDSLMLMLDLNKFINMYVLPYIDTQLMQYYIISRLAMVISSCGIKDLNDKLNITEKDIIVNLDLIYGGKKSKYEQLFTAIDDLNVKNEFFSLFASLRKMSHYLLKDLIIKVLSTKNEDQLQSLFPIIVRQYRIEQRLTTPQGVFIEQCSTLFEELIGQPVEQERRNLHVSGVSDAPLRKSVAFDNKPIDMTESHLARLQEAKVNLKDSKVNLEKKREQNLKKLEKEIADDAPAVERSTGQTDFDVLTESRIGGGADKLKKQFGTTQELQPVTYNVTQGAAKQYQQLIKPEDKADFLAQMMVSQAQPSTLLRYDFLQLLNKELLSESNPQVLIAIAELLTAFPSTLTSRYCMGGILQLLLKKTTYTSAYRLLQALGSESLFGGTVTSRNNELARAMAESYEKAGQRVQGAVLGFLAQELTIFADGAEELAGRLKCNDFIRKLYKHASQHKLSGDPQFAAFCRQCETSLDMSAGTPGTRQRNIRSRSPSATGAVRAGSTGTTSRAQSRQEGFQNVPRTPTRPAAPKASIYDSNGHIIRQNARSPGPSQVKDGQKSPSAINLRSLSQMQKLSKSIIQDPPSRSNSKQNIVKPINKYLERCKAMDFRRVYSLEYLKKQLLIASPGAKLGTLVGVFDVVRDAIKSIEKYEQQLDVLFQLIIYYVRENIETTDVSIKASTVSTEDDGSKNKMHGSHQKLLEQLIKALKVSSVQDNRYVIYCTVYFIFQILQYWTAQKQVFYQLFQSFYQQLDLDFWQAISTFKMAYFDDFLQAMQLFNKSINYKPLELYNDQMTSYYQINFLVTNMCKNLDFHDSYGEQVLIQSSAASSVQVSLQLSENAYLQETGVQIAQRLNINNLQALRHFLQSKSEESGIVIFDDARVDAALELFQPVFDQIQHIPAIKQSAQAMQKSLKQIKNGILDTNVNLSRFIDKQQEEQEQINVIEENLLKSAVNIQSDEKIIEFVKKYRNYFDATSGFIEDSVKIQLIDELTNIQQLPIGQTLELLAGFLTDLIIHNLTREIKICFVALKALTLQIKNLTGNQRILTQLMKIVTKLSSDEQNTQNIANVTESIALVKEGVIKCMSKRDIPEQITIAQESLQNLDVTDGFSKTIPFIQVSIAASILMESLSKTLCTPSDDQKVLQQMRDVIRDTTEPGGQNSQFIRNTALHLFQGFINAQQKE